MECSLPHGCMRSPSLGCGSYAPHWGVHAMPLAGRGSYAPHCGCEVPSPTCECASSSRIDLAASSSSGAPSFTKWLWVGQEGWQKAVE